MVLDGIVKKIDNCYGICEVNDKLYKFPLNIVYGNMISVNDHIKIRFDDDIPKIVTKYEIIELEEFLNVD